jgi:hypothetical protein
LILLSTGEQDLNPTSALLEAIVIQEPRAKALITGGKVLVSGVARPDTDLPLRVELIDNEGKVVGQRLVNVSRTSAGGYGDFAAEVPYTVSALTPVRLVVYEDGENISPMVHLSSQEIVLSP